MMSPIRSNPPKTAPIYTPDFTFLLVSPFSLEVQYASEKVPQKLTKKLFYREGKSLVLLFLSIDSSGFFNY